MPRNKVVITGLGVVSSIGIGGDAFFQGLLQKRSGITFLSNRTDEGAKPGACRDPAGLWIGGPIIGFDPKQYVRPRKALKVMCREIQTAYAASQLAIDNAELSELLPADPAGPLKPHHIGTVFGGEMFYGPPSDMEDAIRGCMRDDGTFDGSMFGNVAMKKVTPLWMLKYLPNMPACHVGIAVNAQGPNNSLVLGDVSGPAAMIEAASCIERGIAHVMITGASGTRINTTRMNYRGDLPIAEVFDPVEQSSRPHDPASKGVVGGEGAAALILENPDHATKRGATPIASFVSCGSHFVPSKGMNQSIRSGELSKPGMRGSADSIRLAAESALSAADLQGDQIGLIISHSMGEPDIDAAEREALASVASGRPITAPIASLGHTGAASGTIGLVTAALALASGTVPPTMQTETTARDVGFRDRPEPMDGDHVLCLSHTSEGRATAIILAKP